MTPGTMFITGNDEADSLLNSDANSLLMGMLLDQQVPMEWAFLGPFTLRCRLSHLDPAAIAAMDQEEFVQVCCERPAIHRFPAAMGRRIHELSISLTASYGGDAAQLWADSPSGAELYRRLRTLPGYGDEKAKIFIAILGKRFDQDLVGWREAAGKFGDDVPRSVADIEGLESLALVRAWKKAQKQAKLDKQDRPLPATESK